MSVFKRGGVYWYEFWFQGLRYRASTGLNNKTAALRVEAIRKAELAEGRAGFVRREPSPSFEKFVTDEFLPWSAKEHAAKPRTHRRYEVSLKPLNAFFGAMPIDSITAGQVEHFKTRRAAEISAAGTNRDMAALRYVLNFAMRQGPMTQNAVNGVRFLPEGPGMMRVVSQDEQQRYLAVANPDLRDAALLMVETGMCPEEVYTLQKDSIHLQQGYLLVASGKTKFRRRNVPLTAATAKMLKTRTAFAKGLYVFQHRHDPNKALTSLKKSHERALKDSNIKPRFRLYDLRHTFGSRAVMAGVDLATVKELMGHSNISTTMRYVHPTPEHKREAVRKLERFNVEKIFADVEDKRLGYPQKSPQ